MTNTDLAEQLFTALQSGDMDAVRALCSPDFRGSQNGGPAMNLETLIGFTTAVHAAVENFRYEDAVRTETATGFIEEHRVRARLPDGGELDMMVCVIGEVADGKIIRLREYADTGAAAGLLKALGR